MRVHSHEGEPEEQQPAQSAPAPAHVILQLQQSAGNAAVARQLLLRDGPAVKAKGIEKQFDDAIKNKFWNLLASLLDGNREAGAKKLATLGIDQLRILDDAARRIGLADQWLRTEVKTKLKAKGLTDKQAEPGMAYGKVEAKETVKENGDLTARPKKRFRYRVEVEFTPNEAAVKADEIAFVQTIRVVDTCRRQRQPVRREAHDVRPHEGRPPDRQRAGLVRHGRRRGRRRHDEAVDQGRRSHVGVDA